MAQGWASGLGGLVDRQPRRPVLARAVAESTAKMLATAKIRGESPIFSMLQVEVCDGQVLVHELVIPSPEVAGFLERAPEGERVKKLIDATEVGAACLERATATLNLDFVRQQCEQQLRLLTGACART